MCGITGVVNLKHNVDKKLFVRMNNIIKHRGPDDEGYTIIAPNKIVKAYGIDSAIAIKERYINIEDIEEEFPIIFGHRRLSILDLSENGHQPMSDETDNIHITYNGEIYNYIEIREELKEKGYKFKTNCDTEVILNSYKEWGEDCVNHFNGMWAFAIFDKEKSKIFCSRDRFGVKPFYYYYDEDKIIFSSEAKQIIEDSNIERIANDKVIYNFLFYGNNDYNEDTFFKNIYALPPSHNMIIYLDFENKKTKIEKKRYYDFKREGIEKNEDNAIKKFKEDFKRSIEYRLRSDITVGSCLSGGLDSSSVVTQACNNLKDEGKNNNFQTFTACYNENPEIDERYFSQKVVQKSGCKENLIFPNEENLEKDIEKVTWHQDFPFPSLSIYAQWNVMKGAAKKNVKVLLDGQGADETLLGYERYAIYLLRDNFKHFKFITMLKNYNYLKSNLNVGVKRIVTYFLSFSHIDLLKYFVKRIKNFNTLNNQFLRENKHNKDYVKNVNFKDCFELIRTEVFFSNLGSLLRYEDRDSMAFSIETRVPFLDYKLVENEMKIPVDLKIKDGWTKNILRKAMKDDMDQEVVYRKNKLGFVAPQKDWLNELDEEYINSYLNNMKTKKYFNVEKIKHVFKNKTNDELRWKFLSLEIWMKLFDVKIENEEVNEKV